MSVLEERCEVQGEGRSSPQDGFPVPPHLELDWPYLYPHPSLPHCLGGFSVSPAEVQAPPPCPQAGTMSTFLIAQTAK